MPASRRKRMVANGIELEYRWKGDILSIFTEAGHHLTIRVNPEPQKMDEAESHTLAKDVVESGFTSGVIMRDAEFESIGVNMRSYEVEGPVASGLSPKMKATPILFAF